MEQGYEIIWPVCIGGCAAYDDVRIGGRNLCCLVDYAGMARLELKEQDRALGIVHQLKYLRQINRCVFIGMRTTACLVGVGREPDSRLPVATEINRNRRLIRLTQCRPLL